MKNINKILISASIFALGTTYKAQALNVNYIRGIDRYETASIIAADMEYSSVILVNGYAIVDGLSASGLSGATNSPILLTEKDAIPPCTQERINKASKVYIVGGESVVSQQVEKSLRANGKEVVRIGGLTRFDTSNNVANTIESIKGIQELYYVNGERGEADAMSIAPIAATTGNPVILTDGNEVTYSRNVKKYAIGGKTVLGSHFDNFAERVGGIDRFETNKAVIKRFYTSIDHVNLSKSDVLIDALTSSALKDPVVLVADNSDKTILNGGKSLTVLGNISDKAVARAKAHIYGDKVVFYVQHQDDETIFAGSAIVDAIQAVGKENVYVVLITNGSGTNVFSFERYRELSLDEKIALRDNEFKAAVSALDIESRNVICLNQYEDEIDDNLLREQILSFENNYKNVTHVIHSYKYETHKQHLASGKVMLDLYNSGLIKDCRFIARYDRIANIPKENLIESVAENQEEKQKVLKACNEYMTDNKDMVREAIGYKSVSSLFDNLIKKEEVPSFMHN